MSACFSGFIAQAYNLDQVCPATQNMLEHGELEGKSPPPCQHRKEVTKIQKQILKETKHLIYVQKWTKTLKLHEAWKLQ